MKVTLLESFSNTTPVGHTTFSALIKKMRTDETLLAEARALWKADTATYEAMKKKLPAFMVGGFSKREEAGLVDFEPFLCFDIDHIAPENMGPMFERLSTWEYTYVLYPSPSCKGFRLFIRTDASVATRPMAYHMASNILSVFSGLPLEEELSPADRKVLPVINTSTGDLPRLWFYTGILKFFYNKDHRRFDVPRPDVHHDKADDADRVEELVKEIEKSGIDITADYESWYRVGMSLASAFGENGRGFFHRVSSYNDGYDHTKADKKYDNFVKSGRQKISIATFFKLAKDHGIQLSYRPAHERMYPSATWDDVSAERMLCAFCASGPHAYQELISAFPNISSNCFKDEAFSMVFSVLEDMDANSKYIDPINVHERVKSFFPEIREDCKSAPTLEAATGYADTVFTLYRKSEVARILLERSNEVAGGVDVDKVLSVMDSEILKIGGGEETEDDTLKGPLDELLKRRQALFLRLAADEGSIPGTTTGLKKEDGLTGGRMPGTLNILAARPGMGKTAKMLMEALATAKAGDAIGIVSLEMEKVELVKRLICIEGRIPNEQMKNPLLLVEEGNDGKAEETARYIASLPIYMVDKVFSFRAIKAKIREWVRKGVKKVFIDYLGLIKSDSKSDTHKKLGEITKDLKRLAKELGIPINPLHQLSRAVEGRGGSKRPQLSDLRDSGEIEEDADTVTFIYRPWYYDIKNDSDGYSTENMAEVIIEKNRDGDTDTIIVGCDLSMFLFMDEVKREREPLYNNQAARAASIDTENPF